MTRYSGFSVVALLGIYALLTSPVDCHGEKTEFVLVHGAGHGAWCWYKVVTFLRHSGYEVTAIDLLPGGRDHKNADSVTSLSRYAKPLTDYLQNVTTKVILVGHSLGGVPISYAMEQHPEKILKAIFVTAFMPKNNQCGTDPFAPEVLGGLVTAGAILMNHANGPEALPTSVTVNPDYKLLRKYLYSECPDEAIYLGMSLAGAAPYIALKEKLTLTPQKYGSVPRYFISTGKDKILSKSAQETMLKANPPLEVFYLDQSDHMPFFSCPEELASLLYYISIL